MFPYIERIEEFVPHVEHKKEIVFIRPQHGITVVCYQIADSGTFDNPYALEARGISFDENGAIASRPLHKFFNVGERSSSMLSEIESRPLHGVFEKMDGSMIATCRVGSGFLMRSKKSFSSGVAKLAQCLVDQSAQLTSFCQEITRRNLTAIFELMHPEQRIVVAVPDISFRLLHVRDNVTGEYVLLNPSHVVHDLIEQYHIPQVERHLLSLPVAQQSLEEMTGREGYVYQFENGDMVKAKSPWYLRLHGVVTFLRRRDVALAALHENLDDIKSALREVGIDIEKVEQVESELKNDLLDLQSHIDQVLEEDKSLTQKEIAIKRKGDPLFGMIMNQFNGKESSLKNWYERNRLKEKFGLEVLQSIGDEGWETKKTSTLKM